jgi:hypothetical protein
VTEYQDRSPEIITIPAVESKGTIGSLVNRLLWSDAKTPTEMMIPSPVFIQHMDLAVILGLSIGAVVLVHVVLRKPWSALTSQCSCEQGRKARNILAPSQKNKLIRVRHLEQGKMSNISTMDRRVNNRSQRKQYLVLKISFMY